MTEAFGERHESAQASLGVNGFVATELHKHLLQWARLLCPSTRHLGGTRPCREEGCLKGSCGGNSQQTP